MNHGRVGGWPTLRKEREGRGSHGVDVPSKDGPAPHTLSYFRLKINPRLSSTSKWTTGHVHVIVIAFPRFGNLI